MALACLPACRPAGLSAWVGWLPAWFLPGCAWVGGYGVSSLLAVAVQWVLSCLVLPIERDMWAGATLGGRSNLAAPSPPARAPHIRQRMPDDPPNSRLCTPTPCAPLPSVRLSCSHNAREVFRLIADQQLDPSTSEEGIGFSQLFQRCRCVAPLSSVCPAHAASLSQSVCKRLLCFQHYTCPENTLGGTFSPASIHAFYRLHSGLLPLEMRPLPRSHLPSIACLSPTMRHLPSSHLSPARLQRCPLFSAGSGSWPPQRCCSRASSRSSGTMSCCRPSACLAEWAARCQKREKGCR